MARTRRRIPIAIDERERYIWRTRDWGWGGTRGSRRAHRRARQDERQRDRRRQQREAVDIIAQEVD